jgi:hypothetical protein
MAFYNDNSDNPNLLSVADYVELPRPGGTFKLNKSKSLALWSSSQYNFAQARTEKVLYTVDLTGEAHKKTIVLSGLEYSEALFLDDNTILYLRPPTATGEPEVEENDHSNTRSDEEQSQYIKKRAEVKSYHHAFIFLDSRLESPIIIN